MMRPRPLRLLLLLLLSMCMATALPLAAQQTSRYLADVPDLPLMPGLREMPDSGLVFDKPGGRIVEAYASGALNRREVMAFYAETLPQLGWRSEHGGSFLREGERLQLTLTESAGGVTVQFRLFPQ